MTIMNDLLPHFFQKSNSIKVQWYLNGFIYILYFYFAIQVYSYKIRSIFNQKKNDVPENKFSLYLLML